MPLRYRGRAHGIHGVHDKVKQNLLQLDGIARRQQEPVLQVESDADLATNQFAVK